MTDVSKSLPIGTLVMFHLKYPMRMALLTDETHELAIYDDGTWLLRDISNAMSYGKGWPWFWNTFARTAGGEHIKVIVMEQEHKVP